MGTDLVPAPQTALETAAEATAAFVAASQANNTRRAYRADWADFENWCAAAGRPALPAEPATVALYLGALASRGRKTSTVRRRCAAIGDKHRAAGHDSPAAHPFVAAALQGIARTLGSAPAKKAALTVDLVKLVLRRIPEDLTGIRDRALLLIAFAAAFRVSELVGLDAEDIGHHPKGLVLTVRRSKTDQLGHGKVKAVPRGRRLPIAAALETWLARAGITCGPVFRGVRGERVLAGRLTARQVARIIKARAAGAGLDPKLFATHSARSGFITSADAHGAKLEKNAAHAHHRRLDTTRGYVQVADAFRDHPGKGFL